MIRDTKMGLILVNFRAGVDDFQEERFSLPDLASLCYYIHTHNREYSTTQNYHRTAYPNTSSDHSEVVPDDAWSDCGPSTLQESRLPTHLHPEVPATRRR